MGLYKNMKIRKQQRNHTKNKTIKQILTEATIEQDKYEYGYLIPDYPGREKEEEIKWWIKRINDGKENIIRGK